MHASILFSAAFVAAVLAAPHHQHQHQRRDQLNERKIVWNIKTVTDTVYVTEGYESTTAPPKPSPQPVTTSSTSSTPPAPTTTAVPSTTTPVVVATPVVVVTPPAPTSTSVYVAPVPTTSAVSTPPATTDGNSVLATCNKYRSLYNLKPFAWSSTLASNAGATGEMNGGSTQNHKLFDGSMGQVITPGLNSAVSGVDLKGLSPFEMAYLSWMCESSGDSQLSGLCDEMQQAMHMEYSSLGHYNLLTSSTYTEIGCGFTPNPGADSNSPYQGIWVCDLGY